MAKHATSIPAPSRRTLFAGALLMPPLAAFTALPAQASDQDAEFLNLGRRYRELDAQISLHNEQHDALYAKRDAMLPTAPEVLKVRFGDVGWEGKAAGDYHTAYTVHQIEKVLPEWRESVARKTHQMITHERRIERAETILAAHHDWWIIKEGVTKRSGLEAWRSANLAMYTEMDEIITASFPMMPTTLDGLRIKARIAKDQLASGDWRDGDMDFDERAYRSLIDALVGEDA